MQTSLLSAITYNVTFSLTPQTLALSLHSHLPCAGPEFQLTRQAIPWATLSRVSGRSVQDITAHRPPCLSHHYLALSPQSMTPMDGHQFQLTRQAIPWATLSRVSGRSVQDITAHRPPCLSHHLPELSSESTALLDGPQFPLTGQYIHWTILSRMSGRSVQDIP